jgi:hypothetical protein
MGKVVDRMEEKKRRPSLSDDRKGAQRKPCSNRLSRRMSLISDAEHLSFLDRFYETDVSSSIMNSLRLLRTPAALI